MRCALADPIVIVGAGPHGRDVLDVVEAAVDAGAPYEFVGFLDDNPVADELLARRDQRVLGPVSLLGELDARYVAAVGDGAVRERLNERAREFSREPATIIHPSVTFGGDVSVGPGCVLLAGARLTNHIRLGRHVHVNQNATVAHDCALGDYVTVNPGANVSGNVRLQAGVTIGTGAVLIQGVTIGAGTIVGAGAVVTEDLPPGITAVGVPARPR